MPHQAHVLEHITVCEKKDDIDKTKVMATLQNRDLFETRGLTLGEALKKITGVTTLQTGPSISKPVIHGMHSNRVLMMSNGVRLEGQQWGSEHAPEIDPFLAKEISLVKGAASVRYGSDAIAGVVLVNPAAMPNNQKISGEILLTGNTNSQGGTVSGILEGNFKKVSALSWRVQATAKRNGNTRTPNYWLKNTGNTEVNFSAALAYHKDTWGIDVFYSQFNSKIGIFAGSHIGNLTDLENAIARQTPNDTSGFSYTIDRPYQKVQHNTAKLSAYLLTGTSGKLSYTFSFQNNHRREWDKHKPLNDSLAALNKPEFDFHIFTLNNELIWESNNYRNFTSSVGASWMFQNNYTEGRYFIPNFISHNAGLFFIQKYKKNKWELEAGIRGDYKYLLANVKNGNTFPSETLSWKNMVFDVGGSYEISHSVTTRINFGKAWRAPAVNELFANGLHHGAASVEVGNKNLKLESAYNLTAEIDLKVKELLRVNLSAYTNFINNYIYLQPVLPATLTISGAFPTFDYRQANALFMGIDADARLKVLKPLYLLGKASLLRAENRNTAGFFPMIPANRYEGGVEIKPGNWKVLSDNYFKITGLYVSRQSLALSLIDYAPPPPAYYLLNADLGGSIKLKHNTLNLGISVQNILNTRYRDYMDRFRYYADAAGINVLLRVQFVFNN